MTDINPMNISNDLLTSLFAEKLGNINQKVNDIHMLQENLQEDEHLELVTPYGNYLVGDNPDCVSIKGNDLVVHMGHTSVEFFNSYCRSILVKDSLNRIVKEIRWIK